jgi:hypothetical protein
VPNRSIHVKAKDVPTWEAAKAKAKLLGVSMSKVIETGLREWVKKRERDMALGLWTPPNKAQADGRMKRTASTERR